METSRFFLLMLVFAVAQALQFPGYGDDPLIAVLDYRKKLLVFNPTLGADAPVIEDIDLLGGENGASTTLDFNYRGNAIYWCDVFTGRIYRMQVGGITTNQTVINPDYEIKTCDGLAYDWIHDNLYVADWMTDKIYVVDVHTGARRTIIEVERARQVQVDPQNGFLYYLGGWADTARLYKNSLNGDNEEVLIDSMRLLKGLSLDSREQRLYFGNVPKSIYSVDINGNDLQVVYNEGETLRNSIHLLTVSRDYIYWTQLLEGCVMGRKKYNANETVRYSNLEKHGDMFYDIIALDPLKQPEGFNVCGSNKGGCSHFCLPTIGRTPAFICACPDNQVLMQDNKTCIN